MQPPELDWSKKREPPPHPRRPADRGIDDGLCANPGGRHTARGRGTDAVGTWQQIAEGPAISLDAARRVGTAASRYARDNQFTVVIAITDVHGNLVYFERADNTMTGANQIALDKARTAARFKRSTKVLEDAVSAGGPGLRLLSVDGLLASEGGLPILVEGRIVGAIGVSGATNVQDGLIATEGLRALR
jgi:glc operon protein GlcG